MYKRSLIINLSIRVTKKNIISTKTERTTFFVNYLIDESILYWHISMLIDVIWRIQVIWNIQERSRRACPIFSQLNIIGGDFYNPGKKTNNVDRKNKCWCFLNALIPRTSAFACVSLAGGRLNRPLLILQYVGLMQKLKKKNA